MATKIVIYGTGPFAELMHYHFTHDSDDEVVAFCLDTAYLSQSHFCSLPVVAFEAVTEHYPVDQYSMFVAIGYSKMRNRALLFDKAKAKGYVLVNFISRNAITRENLIIGENNVIHSSTDVDCFVRIGNNNVFWTGSVLGHHLVVGNHNYFSGNCGLGGNCVIGDACFMGNAAVMVNNIRIADETYLVAGTVILRDTEAASRYHGNPAKLVSRHTDTGILIA